MTGSNRCSASAPASPAASRLPQRMPLRFCCLLMLCCHLSACVVIPHPRDVVELSRVDGRLNSGGRPVAGVSLTMNALDNPAACEDPIARVFTGAHGEFAFDEITSRAFWRVVILAPSSPTYYMTLCLEDDSGPAPIFDQQIWASLPVTLSLHCDLAAAEDPQNRCEVTDWTGYNFLKGSEHYREFRQPDPPASDAAGHRTAEQH